MRNKQGVFILFAIIIIGVFIIAIQRNKNITDKDASEQPVDLEQLAKDYHDGLQVIMPEYKALIDNTNQEAIDNMRQKLLDLKMPTEFKEAHVQLVLLLEQMEQGVSAEDLQINFNNIINKYDWLN
ncbi:MAG: hypothetical protein ABIH48_00820 [Candidatus Falkowbacteria bacterium]